MIGTTVHGAGAAVGRIDPTPWEQEHTALEVSQRLLAYPGGVSPLSCFESLEVNAQGFDFRFERLPRQAQLGRRAGGAGHAAKATSIRARSCVPGPVVGLKQCQGLLADGPDLLPGSCRIAL